MSIIKNDRSQALLRAGIEAGVVASNELTIVVVVDAHGCVDVASCAPSHAAADLIVDGLVLAIEKVTGARADLKEKIMMGKA